MKKITLTIFTILVLTLTACGGASGSGGSGSTMDLIQMSNGFGVMVPYQVAVHPPHDCIYTAGQYQPGGPSWPQRQRGPLSAKGALATCGVLTSRSIPPTASHPPPRGGSSPEPRTISSVGTTTWRLGPS